MRSHSPSTALPWSTRSPSETSDPPASWCRPSATTRIDIAKFDPEKARALLAEAGYPGGEGFPEVDFLTGDRDTAKAIAETVQAMWKEHLGISIKIRQTRVDLVHDRDFRV